MRAKKLMVTVITTLLLLTSFFTTAVNAEFESTADSALLMEFSTGNVLYQKNADIAKPPASITKLMTLLLSLEAIEAGRVTWETPVTISENAWRMGGSQMFLEVGQEVSFRDLITGISVVSANDACVAVAEHLTGSEAVFVSEMNNKAKEIGLKHANFVNSTGLPAEGHVMSAADIAVLSRHLLLNYPEVLEFESQKEFTFNDIKQYNRNPLLRAYNGADGLKTGWTDEAGYCLSGTAQRDGMRLIAVLLNTESEAARLAAAEQIMDYGFINYQLYEAAKEGQIIKEVPVVDGRKLLVPAKTATNVTVPVKKNINEQIELVVIEEEEVRAPVEAGEKVATLEVRLANEVLDTTELVAAETVSRANIFVRLLRWFLNLINIGPAS